MERKIGEIFEFGGEWYQCVKGLYCDNCAFVNDNCEDRERITLREKLTKQPTTGFCNSEKRNDRKSVIFKKLEKVGEPFTLTIHVEERLVPMQEYKLYDVNFCKENALLMYVSDYKHKRVAIEIKQNKEDMEEKNEVKGANVLSKEEWCIIEKAQEDWKRIFPDIPLMSSMSVDAFFPHIIKLGLLDKYKEHSNSEKIGKNLKPFDLEAAKLGKPVCTRDGRKARIICFDKGGEQPIVALIEKNEEESIDIFFSNGHSISKTNKVPGDLMMLPEKKEGWVNVYKNQIHNTFESAEEGHKGTTDYIKTIKVSWEE